METVEVVVEVSVDIQIQWAAEIAVTMEGQKELKEQMSVFTWKWWKQLKCQLTCNGWIGNNAEDMFLNDE